MMKIMCRQDPQLVQIMYNFSHSKLLSSLISLLLKMIFKTRVLKGGKLLGKEKFLLFSSVVYIYSAGVQFI